MIIKVSPDKEKAQSIMKMAESRKKFLEKIENTEFATILAENYYEIIKELCTAIILVDGYKTTGEGAHKELIDYMKNYGLHEPEISIMQDLRNKRNKSSYEGKQIESIYIENNRADLVRIIEKLNKILQRGLQ